MDTCVRNGHYEEALGIQQLATKLAKPPRGSIPLVGKVLEDIQASTDWMLSQLLGKLRGQITLPECLKVVGYIRRMAIFSETELRIKFLQAREKYFDSSLQSGIAQAGASDDPYTMLCRVTELTRVSVFDTITQYRALFSDDDMLLPPGPDGVSGALAHVSFRQIFSAWIFKRIQNYKKTLETTLEDSDLDEQSLDSLLGQVMYFGQSLGRVGFDFRSQFVPMFTAAIAKKCARHLREGLEHFEMSLKTFSLPTTDLSVQSSPATTGEASLEAPHSLMVHYPIAELSNAVAMALNEMRFCAPVCVAISIFKQIQTLFDAAAEILLRHDRKVSDCTSEAKISRSLIRCFCHDLVPYANRCYRRFFPEKLFLKLEPNFFRSRREFVAPTELYDLVEPEATTAVQPSGLEDPRLRMEEATTKVDNEEPGSTDIVSDGVNTANEPPEANPVITMEEKTES